MRMINATTMRAMAITTLITASPFALTAAQAQQEGIKRTLLQQHDLSVPGHEMVQARVDIDSGKTFPKHTHPGEEIIYMLQGSLEYDLDGKPPVTLKPGEVLFIPAGTAHTVKNTGTVTGSELSTYIVEKGKPLVTLVK